jgi:hypothetical protein
VPSANSLNSPETAPETTRDRSKPLLF